MITLSNFYVINSHWKNLFIVITWRMVSISFGSKVITISNFHNINSQWKNNNLNSRSSGKNEWPWHQQLLPPSRNLKTKKRNQSSTISENQQKEEQKCDGFFKLFFLFKKHLLLEIKKCTYIIRLRFTKGGGGEEGAKYTSSNVCKITCYLKYMSRFE